MHLPAPVFRIRLQRQRVTPVFQETDFRLNHTPSPVIEVFIFHTLAARTDRPIRLDCRPFGFIRQFFFHVNRSSDANGIQFIRQMVFRDSLHHHFHFLGIHSTTAPGGHHHLDGVFTETVEPDIRSDIRSLADPCPAAGRSDAPLITRSLRRLRTIGEMERFSLLHHLLVGGHLQLYRGVIHVHHLFRLQYRTAAPDSAPQSNPHFVIPRVGKTEFRIQRIGIIRDALQRCAPGQRFNLPAHFLFVAIPLVNHPGIVHHQVVPRTNGGQALEFHLRVALHRHVETLLRRRRVPVAVGGHPDNHRILPIAGKRNLRLLRRGTRSADKGKAVPFRRPVVRFHHPAILHRNIRDGMVLERHRLALANHTLPVPDGDVFRNHRVQYLDYFLFRRLASGTPHPG